MFGLGKKRLSPSKIVESTLECVTVLETKPTEDDAVSKAKERVSLSLADARFYLYGEPDSEPKPENVDRIVKDVLESSFLVRVLQSMPMIDFEARKDYEKCFNFMIRRGAQNGALNHVLGHAELLEALVTGYDTEIALTAGSILRECLRHEEVCKAVLEASYFYLFFDYVQRSSFDTAADAFATLKLLLTKHKNLASEFLQDNYEKFFEEYNKLIDSNNYVTKRQSLKLLGEILLDRKNFNVMIRYINDAENLKLMMMLLSGKQKTIQFEAFHVFKVGVIVVFNC